MAGRDCVGPARLRSLDYLAHNSVSPLPHRETLLALRPFYRSAAQPRAKCLDGIVTTAFAAQLLTASPWLSWLGWLWLVAVALNLAAALLLALFYEEPH